MKMGILKRFVQALCIGTASIPLLYGIAHAGKENDTLVWAHNIEVVIADPYYAGNSIVVTITDEVCDNLVYRSPDTGEFLPLLASAFRRIDDLTLEFDLREDVVFHSGKAFSAEDVKYTLDHVSDPDSQVIVRAAVDWIDEVQVVDPYTVRIVSKEPYPLSLDYLSRMLPILPAGHYEEAPIRDGRVDYGAVPLDCTGPYKITEIDPGNSIEFVKNDAYFTGPKSEASIEKLEYRTILDSNAQTIELLAGNVDWITNVPMQQADQLEDAGQVQVQQTPTLRIAYIGFNSSGKGSPSPFQDLQVRRAVAHAINVESIAKNIVGESSQIIASACNPRQTACYTKVPTYDYDPALSRELLAEAGYPDGFSTDLFSYRYREVTEAVVNDLRSAGIDANMRMMQYNALRPMLRSGEASLAFLTWGSYRINDASAFVGYFFTGTEDDVTLDPQLKEWIDEADHTIDVARRAELYQKGLTHIAEQAYIVPLFTMVTFYAATEDLDFVPYFDDLPRFYEANWR